MKKIILALYETSGRSSLSFIKINKLIIPIIKSNPIKTKTIISRIILFLPERDRLQEFKTLAKPVNHNQEVTHQEVTSNVRGDHHGLD